MNIQITNDGTVPIYEQIARQIKGMVLNGTLKEGDALPSMRLLAKELKISVITTKRAYEELERDGFIVSMTGKGSFVAGTDTELLKEARQKELEQTMEELVAQGKELGLSLEELMELMTIIYRGE
ncbi:MAG TPA: GntR family transcriptional regulator [Firmicutes bacterium]|nr:GntR family transcriptional regulator [Bacillota bacterium]